jgi:hypothetical protein
MHGQQNLTAVSLTPPTELFLIIAQFANALEPFCLSVTIDDTAITTEMLTSLACADAVQRNQELMQKFQWALEENPAADLMALIPDSFRQMHQESQFRTSTAMLNQRTLNVLNVFLREDPEINLLSVFPPNYGRRYRLAAQSSISPLERKVMKPRSPPDFRTRLDTAETPTIVFPLSQNVATLLKRFSESDAQPTDAGHALLGPLRQLLWSSQKLWEDPVRGVCTSLTRTLSLTEENDWYSYLPRSISPLQFPIHWLVHRLWDIHVKTS